MDIPLFISALAATVGGAFALGRHLMMLQQSSYFLSRYAKWLKGAFALRSVVALILLAAFSAGTVFDIKWLAPVSAALSLIRIFTSFSDKKKVIKKLVVTARVKRLYVTCAVLAASGLALGLALSPLFFLINAVLSFIIPLAVTAASVINKPLEFAISKHFINDAKRMLREHKGLTVIGITGSYGKTGTKFILSRILSEKFNVLATPESFNTTMGVVRTVREKLTAPTEIFIAEMGAKKKGDIREICDLCEPKLGIVTSVGPQHLESFGSIENVLRTKLELADSVTANGGRIYLNRDNEYLAPECERYGASGFGESEAADVRAENISYGANGLTFDIVKGDIRFSVHTSLLGRHSALNITAAAALALDLGETPEQIAFAVSTLRPVEHRLQMRPYINGSVLIDDAYNANPSGSLAAVDVLAHFDGMKKIIVTPGLVELGEREYEYNKALGKAAGEVCDTVILIGKKRSVPLADGVKETALPPDSLIVVDRFADAAALLAKMCDSNTVVLIENDLPDNYAG